MLCLILITPENKMKAFIFGLNIVYNSNDDPVQRKDACLLSDPFLGYTWDIRQENLEWTGKADRKVHFTTMYPFLC